MKWVIPNRVLETPIEQISCLHVPHHRGLLWESAEDVFQQIAEKSGTTTIVCRPAATGGGFWHRFRRERTQDWLRRNAGVSFEEAARIIEGIPVRVHPLSEHNAGNPRAALGIAAAFARRADCFVYNLTGCDPRGIKLLHEYAATNRGDRRLIHLSWPCFFFESGVPAPHNCPPNAVCFEIEIKEADSLPHE